MCSRIRLAIDRGKVEPAEILDEIVDVNVEVRRAASVEVDGPVQALVDAALDDCRSQLETFHGIALTSREGVSFIRYPPGGFYKPHRDRAFSPAWPDALRRRLALVAFLNDDFTGGELRLLPDGDEPIVIRPQAGTLVAFDASVLHEVLPVGAGVRDTLVDWFY
jgi:predicted 2-oxoglutarate/Fe(II)-dependent dioxygenase YbiX